MNRFVFKLETVLHFRRRMEEMALADFQDALNKEQEAETELDRLKVALKAECQGGVAEGWFRFKRDEYKQQLLMLIKNQSELVMTLHHVTQEKRDRYLETRKETKSLERLREKAMKDHQKEVERQEQQEMDDRFLMHGERLDP